MASVIAFVENDQVEGAGQTCYQVVIYLRCADEQMHGPVKGVELQALKLVMISCGITFFLGMTVLH